MNWNAFEPRCPGDVPTIKKVSMDCSKKSSFDDPISEFETGMKELGANLRAKIKELEPYVGSEALKFAMAAGLPPQMAYTVPQTALYSGVSKATLYEEHSAGRLKFKTLGKRNALITVTEMDRWMGEESNDEDHR